MNYKNGVSFPKVPKQGKNPVKTILAHKKRKIKTPLKKAKDKLWTLCKEITRKYHGNTCYTCGKKGLEGSNWHTGHFLTDSTCSTELSYDLRNLRPQCYHCNINLSGNWIAFEERLRADHGQKYIDELKQRNRDTKGLSYRIDWYEDKILLYTVVLKKIII